MALFNKQMVAALLQHVKDNYAELYPVKGTPGSNAISRKAWEQAADFLNSQFNSDLDWEQVRNKMKELKRSRSQSKAK